eukprot:TRINITY_DN69295_c0_g1_i1.p1 TRINITY_DN69295_c0_g1~~TRINITY_DN69295_c0_g1_i1.p1  ORF type:complete len:431 (+),score=76.76 TRINITY_DN69295_c0_g1_i1:32-1324(+)
MRSGASSRRETRSGVSREIDAFSSSSRHVERMGRARNQRAMAADLREELALAMPGHEGEWWQQRSEQNTAKHMLQSMAECGVDEDLEMLRASWAGGPPRRRGNYASTGGLSLGDPPSELRRRGDAAMRRLQTIEDLRHVAAGRGPSPASVTPQRGRSTDFFGAFTAPGHLNLQALTDSDAFEENTAPAFDSNDPWNAWESRWQDAFNRFESAEQKRRNAARMREEEEAAIAAAAAAAAASAAAAAAAASASARRKTNSSTTKGTSSSPPSTGSSSSTRAPGFSRPATGPFFGQARSGPQGQRPTGASSPAPPRISTPAAAEATAEPRFTHFGAWENAWSTFEASARGKGGSQLSFAEIPWPQSLPTISGVQEGDDGPARKKKLRTALLRWHPDKWAPILERVRESDRARVTEQVKEVTRRILVEKDRYGG